MITSTKKMITEFKDSAPVLWLRKSKYEKKFENNKYLKGIHNISFDTTNLESGTYFIKCQSNEMVNNVKFVVSH